MVIELAALAIASALWPLLLAFVVVALQGEHPARLLASFLAGGLLTTVATGTVVALALQRTSFVTRNRPPADPVVYLSAGILTVLVAFVVKRLPERTRVHKEHDKPTLYERVLRRGAPLAFAAGVVLNVLPGVLPLVALKDIAQLDYGTAATLAAVTVFYVVMFTLVEVPLVGFVASPERTTTMTVELNRWLGGHSKEVVIVVLRVVAAYLLIRGAISLVR